MKERRQSQFQLHVGSCVDLLKLYPDNHFDSVVTDPPYDLTANKKGGSGEASVNLETPYGRARITTGFMGQAWDGTGIAFKPSTWAEVLRVLKPGGHVLAFGGTRTYHRMVCAIEDAGFEVRDFIAWIYGSGFPKSLDASKAIDQHHGAVRGVVGREKGAGSSNTNSLGEFQSEYDSTEPATDDAKQWDGWGTALKPAIEPICVGRKPLIGTVAENVLAHGTGVLNINGCRVEGGRGEDQVQGEYSGDSTVNIVGGREGGKVYAADLGRWPANVITDGSDVVVQAFPDAPGQLAPIAYGTERRKTAGIYGAMARGHEPSAHTRRSASASLASGGMNEVGKTFYGVSQYEDSGSAARFFKECKPCSSTDASVVENPSTLRNELVASVQEVAAVQGHYVGLLHKESSMGRSMNVTPIESRMLFECVTATIPILGFEFSHESQQEKHFQSLSHVKVVAIRKPIGTTTITASLSRSDGSAESVTLTFISTSLDRGEPDSRFSYCAKASMEDRDEGLEGFEVVRRTDGRSSEHEVPNLRTSSRRNHHPTVKPVDLMRYLVRLVTPPGGVVCDPFMGSGSTGKACMFEGFRFVGMDLTPEYEPIARARILWAKREKYNLDPFGFGL